MTERWRDYFVQQGVFEPGWLKAAVAHWTFNEVLYGYVQRYCPPPGRILDVGCGPGYSDLYFQSIGYEAMGVDNDAQIVALARDVARRLEIPTSFEQADAFDLSACYGRFDLVYSCGVLEHFDRDVTVQLLQEQARCAPRVLIQVPTCYTKYAAQITDERIYSIADLKKIVRDAGMTVISAFGYGDVTVTKGQIWLRRLLPRMIYRSLQDCGHAYSIAVLGERKA